MRLVFSINVEEYDTEKKMIKDIREMLHRFYYDDLTEEDKGLLDTAQVALIRDGDRASLNTLLPKLQGRAGEHYQGRKASLEEISKLVSG